MMIPPGRTSATPQTRALGARPGYSGRMPVSSSDPGVRRTRRQRGETPTVPELEGLSEID